MENYIGKKFGRWTILEIEPPSRHKKATVICSCGSGIKKKIRFSIVKRGESKSCGCLQKEIAKNLKLSHGKAGSSVYIAYYGMLERCYNKNSKFYKNYGGRGIKVCRRWHKFEPFLNDMGEPPSKRHSIDRINNNRGYSPKNCRWATKTEQQNNTRWNVFIEFNGDRKTLSQWSKETGIHRNTLDKRLKKGWPISLVLKREIFKGNQHISQISRVRNV